MSACGCPWERARTGNIAMLKTYPQCIISARQTSAAVGSQEATGYNEKDLASKQNCKGYYYLRTVEQNKVNQLKMHGRLREY